MQRLPAMRQEFGDQMVFVRGQALQHIFEIGVGVMPVEPGALNQAHPLCQIRCRVPMIADDPHWSATYDNKSTFN